MCKVAVHKFYITATSDNT